MQLKNKTALITGAGKKSGIGYAMAKKMAARGANIAIADFGNSHNFGADVGTGSVEEMDLISAELKEEYKINTLAVNVDVTDTKTVIQMVETIKSAFPSVDILCNNAGATFGVPNGVHTYDEDAWIKTVDVNLHGVFRVSKAIVPLMQKKGGCIINTASRAGKVPPLFNGAYAVSKAGVIMLTKVMAKELSGFKIRVNAIPLGRIGTPDEVADMAVYLTSDASS